MRNRLLAQGEKIWHEVMKSRQIPKDPAKAGTTNFREAIALAAARGLVDRDPGEAKDLLAAGA